MDQLAMFLASDDDLNQLLEGVAAGPSVSWPPQGATASLSKTDVLVICSIDDEHHDRVKPFALGVREEAEARLYARLSQTRADLSPLSSWLHVFSLEAISKLRSPNIEPVLLGYEAAWAGVVIAEASILAGRRATQLKMVACLATASFAVGRASAIWPMNTTVDVLEKYDDMQLQIRSIGSSSSITRKAFDPIWRILRSVSGAKSKVSGDEEAIASAIEALARALSWN